MHNHAAAANKPAIIVCASNLGLTALQGATELFLDGTFSTAPPPFKQVVLVHVKAPGWKRAVTVVFSLMTNKVGRYGDYQRDSLMSFFVSGFFHLSPPLDPIRDVLGPF